MAQSAEMRSPATILEEEAWKRHASRVPGASRKTSFRAGFRAGLALIERAKSQLRTMNYLQTRNVELQAEVIELRKDRHYLRVRLASIKRAVNIDLDEE